jgi:hypothetical protein
MSVMQTKSLSTYFNLHRRYFRSINLERDLDKSDAVQGYVPTERSTDALQRFLTAVCKDNTHRAWTITGVYGTGKSAFAHFLAALCSSPASDTYKVAMEICLDKSNLSSQVTSELQNLAKYSAQQGFLRAAATGQREPLSWTIVRALFNGAERYWKKGRKPEVLRQITDWFGEILSGTLQATNQEVLQVLQVMVGEANAPLLLVIDELGKNLEYAAHHQGVADLYLLQQIAELQCQGTYQVYFLGLLHQSFVGYGNRLSGVEQGEWAKIQGRFEDLPFTESGSQMTRLIGHVIDRSGAKSLVQQIRELADDWYEVLPELLNENEISAQVIADAYPLHPLTSLVLPQLCTRYAQNDRSLFTFLTSDEPHSFKTFLNQQLVIEKQVPTLKLHQVYEYFVESTTGIASRVNLQRWAEIQGLIQDAQNLDADQLKVLKTIGVFNLVTTMGALRASPRLVALALCNSAYDLLGQKYWQEIITGLQERGLITYRTQRQELRIWEGSDFDVETAINEQLERERPPLAQILNRVRPLKPLVAQRHYSLTGNLRYFEQRYLDQQQNLQQLRCSADSYDGLIVYWLHSKSPGSVPIQTSDGKPLILIAPEDFAQLRPRAEEFYALQFIQESATQLQKDGVARREVKQRLVAAKYLLDETLADTFHWSNGKNQCWIEGDKTQIDHGRGFQSQLSDLCDRVYHKSLILDNELINRRELTSQGAKARRELIEAMLVSGDQERLGLDGYAPQVAMYYSVLQATGIHHLTSDRWDFQPPASHSGLVTIWQAIEDFCLDAKDEQRSLAQLYQLLAQPPYGVKAGIIPVLLAAVLLYHSADVGIYKDQSFIPVLGAEHFELLVKDPARFSVKSFELLGLRSLVFKELVELIRRPQTRLQSGVRNQSILAVANPLFQFVKKLPAYTLKTQRLSQQAIAVLKALREAKEPDQLLFIALPCACNLPPIAFDEEVDESVAKTLCNRLVLALKEIQTAYENLLQEGQKLLHAAFGVGEESQIREDLRVRARRLASSCLEPKLKQFITAAVVETTETKQWLEAILMVVVGKPTETWADEDLTVFQSNLSQVAQQFKNLEALQTEIDSRDVTEEYMTRRVTFMQPTGQQGQQVLWSKKEDCKEARIILNKFFEENNLKQNSQLKEAVLMMFLEQELLNEAPDKIAEQRDKLQQTRGRSGARKRLASGH